MLSRSAPLAKRPIHGPCQQGPVSLPELDIPVYHTAQPARTMAGVPPISHEYIEPRIRDPRGCVPLRAWGRSLRRAPSPPGLRPPVPAQYPPSPPQPSHQSNVLSPIIDPALVEDKRVLSPDGRYLDHSAVSDMWSSLARGSVKRKSEARGDMKTSSREKASPKGIISQNARMSSRPGGEREINRVNEEPYRHHARYCGSSVVGWQREQSPPSVASLLPPLVRQRFEDEEEQHRPHDPSEYGLLSPPDVEDRDNMYPLHPVSSLDFPPTPQSTDYSIPAPRSNVLESSARRVPSFASLLSAMRRDPLIDS
jgi:hypothetical protein